jgi:hypothetical protein
VEAAREPRRAGLAEGARDCTTAERGGEDCNDGPADEALLRARSGTVRVVALEPAGRCVGLSGWAPGASGELGGRDAREDQAKQRNIWVLFLWKVGVPWGVPEPICFGLNQPRRLRTASAHSAIDRYRAMGEGEALYMRAKAPGSVCLTCATSTLWRRCCTEAQDSQPYQRHTGPTMHLALEELQAVDVALGLSVAPGGAGRQHAPRPSRCAGWMRSFAFQAHCTSTSA